MLLPYISLKFLLPLLTIMNKLLLTLLALGSWACSQPSMGQQPQEENATTGKTTYYPTSVWNVTEGNDYRNADSQFSIYRMKETENLTALWEKGFGTSPTTCSDPKYRFPLEEILNETEKMYDFYRDTLKFVVKGHSLTDKYRMILYFFHNDDQTVYGGGADDKIGAMWLSPGRIQTKPYGAVAHELGHAFQYMVAADGNYGYKGGGTIWEMTSQYMLWQYYPLWTDFEAFHLEAFLKGTYKAFLHPDNQYHSPFVLEYWSEKHGRDFVGRLWRESKEGEDPVMTYKRITGIDQQTFNNEMADAYLRFITWDMDRIRRTTQRHANRHHTDLEALADGWYRIKTDNCPQNYGYNGIQLNVPTGRKSITLHFRGMAGADGFSKVRAANAGWRYGFVAMTRNGERVYSDIFAGNNSKKTFKVPQDTEYLWLMVMGAPTEHWKYGTEAQEQWPYEINLEGTTPKQ